MGLSRNQILRSTEMTPTSVDVPEWGGVVLIRPLTLGEMLDLLPKIRRDGDVSVDLVIACACNEDGSLLFTADDADALKTKHFAPMQRIAVAALKLNRMGGDETDALAKN